MLLNTLTKLKRIVIIFTILLVNLTIFAQLSPITGGRIQNSTTPFGCAISVGTTVIDASTGREYFCITSVSSTTETLTTAAINFKELMLNLINRGGLMTMAGTSPVPIPTALPVGTNGQYLTSNPSAFGRQLA
jgi:hypothetical protein